MWNLHANHDAGRKENEVEENKRQGLTQERTGGGMFDLKRAQRETREEHIKTERNEKPHTVEQGLLGLLGGGLELVQGNEELSRCDGQLSPCLGNVQ